MKRILISGLYLLLGLGTFMTACKQSDIDNAYLNPDGSVTADVQRLWSGMMFNEYVSPRYWNLYTFLIPVMGTYSQLSGYTTTNGVYEQPTAYAANRWNVYYTQTIARYREIEKAYNALTSEDEKAGLQLFLETSRIFLYDQTAQMIDLWGDIPFTSAGQLNAQGTITLASYDDSKKTYTDMLTDLKRISDYLATATPGSFYTTQFTSYDYVNKGSILKWRQYCNSLMLRLAMRISNADEATAKALVTTILSDPAKYPLVSKASESITIVPSGTASQLVDGSGNGVRDGFGVNPFAPGYLVENVMSPSNDPRLRLFFTKNAQGQYHGVLNTLNANQITELTTANYFSRWDSTTFTNNALLPGIVLTSAETWFNVAEANERWGLGSAQTAYENGIRQSIAFWSSINSASNWSSSKETAPTEAEITAFLAQPAIAYGTDNLKKIATQKWADFTVLQANQAWAEWRRTKLIGLNFPVDNGSASAPNPPSRLLYPADESNLNAVNYSSVRTKDNITTKIFWDVK